MTPEQIRAVGLQALTDVLGPDGTIRFLLQFSVGSGDYTAARQAWVNSANLEALLQSLDRYRSEKGIQEQRAGA